MAPAEPHVGLSWHFIFVVWGLLGRIFLCTDLFLCHSVGLCVVPNSLLIVLTAYYAINLLVYQCGTMHRLRTNDRPLQCSSAPIFVAWTHAWITRLSDCFCMYRCMNRILFLCIALGLWIVLWCLCVRARTFSVGCWDLCTGLLAESWLYMYSV